jgi:hypothetical protein
MNDPVSALNKISQLLNSTIQNEAADKNSVFAATAILIQRLRDHKSHNNEHLSGYLQVKIAELEWHSAAMLGFDVTNGHPTDQHHRWACAAIDALLESF